EGAPYPRGALHHGGDPLARLELITDFDSAAAALNDTSWLISCLRDEGTRAKVTKALATFEVGKRAIERAFKEAKESAAAAKKAVAKERKKGGDANPYTIDGGRICTVTYNTEGELIPLPVSNFVAWIVEDVTLDDGTIQTREFEIEGET